MKLSLEQILQLVAIYKNYQNKTLTPIDALEQAVTILEQAGLTLSDVVTLVKEVGPMLKLAGAA